MSKQQFYNKYVSTHYQYVATATEAAYRKRLYVWKSYFLPYLPRQKDGAILEIGSGVGHNVAALKSLGYTNIKGTDYSKECVDICKKNGFDVQLVDERTEKSFYELHRETFGMVVLYDVLEHYSPSDAAVLLTSVHRMLQKDGTLLVSLPNANHPFSNTLLFADITHKCLYNTVSLSQLFRNCGLTRNSFFEMNSYTPYDDNPILRLLKTTLMPLVACIGESFWRMMALSQGILLRECKPTLIAIAKR